MLREIKRAGFAERLFDAGEVTLNYVVGPDNGPPLVLLPAQMATWESYGKVLLPLARRFRVFAPDLRGHGKSGWATGRYSWATLGADVAAFLNRVVGRPALVSGNSSGGLVALWLAANHPDRVAGGVLEDAPVFSAELPRFRDRDRFVYAGLARAVAALGDLEHRDLANYFRDQELPLADGRVRRVPGCLVSVLSAIIRRRAAANPRGRVDVPYLPPALRLLIRSLSTFDPDFARAFVDGRFYEGLNHAEALRRVRCPLLVLHADWFRHPRHGLVGAMDDADAARILELVPQARYRRIAANHVIHYFKPRAFVREVEEFAAQLEWWPGETRRDSS
jgi:pimeloyl-ACP methyl ester carboxylesterase